MEPFSHRTQQRVAPYRLWIAQGGRRYLMHGQRTPGYNNSVPVKSVAHAEAIANEWRRTGVAAPYLYPEWPQGARA